VRVRSKDLVVPPDRDLPGDRGALGGGVALGRRPMALRRRGGPEGCSPEGPSRLPPRQSRRPRGVSARRGVGNSQSPTVYAPPPKKKARSIPILALNFLSFLIAFVRMFPPAILIRDHSESKSARMSPSAFHWSGRSMRSSDLSDSVCRDVLVSNFSSEQYRQFSSRIALERLALGPVQLSDCVHREVSGNLNCSLDKLESDETLFLFQ